MATRPHSATRTRKSQGKGAYAPRIQRLHREAPGQLPQPNATLDCGWGRLLFGQTFDEPAALAAALLEEDLERRDIAAYVRDPHVVLATAPQALFLDPSHTYRLDLSTYRASARRPRGFVVRWLASEADADAVNRIYLARAMVPVRPDLLLEALPSVQSEFPGAVVVFAGAHELPYERYVERCRPLLDEHRAAVRFTGLLTEPEELAAFYAACDVLVLPSQSECFGLVQPEAMLCGTPVVATDIPGARVPVRETGMGVLAHAGDAADLARAIRDVLRDPSRFRRPRAAIAERFSLEATLDAYERLLAEAAGWG